MASKRHLDAKSDSDEPQPKRPSPILPAVNLGPITSLEELDMKVLSFQNKQLWERLEVRRQAETDLLVQIETMQAKQTATDATLSLVNRYWDQLDENINVTLQRLDIKKESEMNEDSNQDEEDAKRKTFHRLLGDKEFHNIKENVASRLEFSRRAFAKVVDAINTERGNQRDFLRSLEDNDSVDDKLRVRLDKLQETNSNLERLASDLQAEHHKFHLGRSDLEEKIDNLVERVEELQETAENARWELKKTKLKEDRLTRHLTEALDKLSKGVVNVVPGEAASTAQDPVKSGDKSPSDEYQILADSRLAELKQMREKNEEVLKEVEKLRANALHAPENLILQSAEYKTLKSQFAVLYRESVQMKNLLDESRSLMQTSRHNHLRRIEQMESDELQTQKKLRDELVQLEDSLTKVRHDYEALHSELEQNLAASEQAGPVNREMRHLINSLQNHNRQLKGELQRYKRKMKDMQHELSKAKQAEIKRLGEGVKVEVNPTVKIERTDDVAEDVVVKTEVKVEEQEQKPSLNEEELLGKIECGEQQIKALKEELKESQDQIKELKLLLDMYKGLSKEQREKAEIMASEKTTKISSEKLAEEMGMLQEKVSTLEEEYGEARMQAESKNQQLEEVLTELQEEKDKSRFPKEDPEMQRKLKVLEESASELKRNLAATKQEEEALLSEMEVTGQAFEDMQEQNMRLLQQLREKDDANFKLMSERIKANQIHKLLQEEKFLLQDQATTLQEQVESQNLVVRKLEEKEKVQQTALMTLEKELALRLQVMEFHKRKAVEMTQTTDNLNREFVKQKERLVMLEESVDRKVESLEEEHFKLSRLQEDGAKLRRKLEKHKKTEGLYSADEVLMEEIKEYKTKLRCPCCNVNNKDAVLTKCFHVFCIKCIKTRYETRQRKCPKCNAGFGGNDFHRIYIE